MDPAGIDRLGRVSDAAAPDDPVTGDFRQRHQYESTLEQPRMRQSEIWLVKHQIIICDDIDIGSPRSVALLVSAIAAELVTLCPAPVRGARGE